MTNDKFDIGCVIPIHGRGALTEKTISRLSAQAGCNMHLVIVGDSEDDKVIAGRAGRVSDFYFYRNAPLGAKWQFGIDVMRNVHPEIDAYLHIGSDDWLTDDYCSKCAKVLSGDPELSMVGVKGFYVLGISGEGIEKSHRLIYWPGYNGARAGEPLGAGRMIPKSVMDSLEWMIMDTSMNSALDGPMFKKVTSKGKTATLDSLMVAVLGVKVSSFETKNSFEILEKESSPMPPLMMELFLEKNFAGAMDVSKALEVKND